MLLESAIEMSVWNSRRFALQIIGLFGWKYFPAYVRTPAAAETIAA
jgi:hypothetical protein